MDILSPFSEFPIVEVDVNKLTDIDYCLMSKDFIRTYKKILDWNKISKLCKLDTEFMLQYINFVNMKLICMYQVLDTDFMDEVYTILDWGCVIKYQKNLTENILWKYILYIENKTEGYFNEKQYEFIETIFLYRKFSKDFINNFFNFFEIYIEIKKLNLDYFYEFQDIDNDLLENFSDIINWTKIVKYNKVSDEIIMNFEEYINWDYYTYCNFNLTITQYSDELYLKLFKFRNYLNWDFISRKLVYLPEFFISSKSNKSKLFKLTNPYYYFLYKNRMNTLIKLQKYTIDKLYKPFGAMYFIHEQNFKSFSN